MTTQKIEGKKKLIPDLNIGSLSFSEVSQSISETCINYNYHPMNGE